MKDHGPEWKYVAIAICTIHKYTLMCLCVFYKVQNVVIFWLF